MAVIQVKGNYRTPRSKPWQRWKSWEFNTHTLELRFTPHKKNFSCKHLLLNVNDITITKLELVNNHIQLTYVYLDHNPKRLEWSKSAYSFVREARDMDIGIFSKSVASQFVLALEAHNDQKYFLDFVSETREVEQYFYLPKTFDLLAVAKHAISENGYPAEPGNHRFWISGVYGGGVAKRLGEMGAFLPDGPIDAR